MAFNTLWAGGDDLSFQKGGVPVVVTISGWFNAGFAECALAVHSTGNPVKGNSFPGGAVASGWLHFLMFPSQSWGDFAANTTQFIGGWGQSSTYNGLVIGCIGGNYGGVLNQVTLFKYDGTTLTALATESGTSLTNLIINQFDIQLVNYGATATVRVYVNNNLVITFTGDVTVSGMTDSDCVIFGIPWSGADADYGFSEVIVGDSDTRAVRLVTQHLTANGNTDQWTGDYTDWNPVTIDTSNSVYTNTIAQIEEAELSSLPSGPWSPLACLLAVYAEATEGSDVGTLDLGWYTNSTVNVDGGHSLTSAWECYERLALINPVTTNPWQPSEINALQVCVESET